MVKLLLLTTLTGCTLFGSDPPKNECTCDQDCFRAQGEHCNLDKHVCEPSPDGGMPDAP